MTLAQNDLPEALRFTSSWSIGEDAYRAIVTDMRERNAQCVVEFGSGTSTVRFSRDLQAAIVSIESDAKYVQQTSDEVNAHGESQKVQLHHRPIAWQRHALSFFRSFEPGVFPSGIDAVLIDGPPITTRRGREACLYQVFANANVGCRIYLDDYCRKSEQRIVKNWLRAYSGALKLVQTFDVDHTIAVLEKTSDLRTSPLPRFKNTLDSLFENAKHFAP